LNVASVSQAPRITGPSSLRRGSALELDWDSLYFVSYLVDIYSAEDDRNPVERQVTEDSSAVFSTAPLEAGDYIVSVVGFNPESPRSVRVAGVPAEARFTVTPPVSPPPIVIIPAVVMIPETEPVVVEPEPVVMASEPVIIEPEPPRTEGSAASKLAAISRIIPGSLPSNGHVFTTEQLASASSMNFAWESNAPEYRFTLYRANGEVVVSPSFVNVPSFTMQNPRTMEPGDYVWEIIERDRRGNPGESMAARFSVREGPMVLRTLPTNNPGVLYGNR
jgi:hypothetical protein